MNELAVGGLVQHRRLGFSLWLGGGWLGGGTALASGLAVLLGHRRWSLVWNAFVRLEFVG